ncbi:HutD family protein [Specibacter sp. NPDC057265]|uniref:HutD/Ves family protein n=1 Tax=Specibacter sp. NPDC057265 TaxID=3346075 RepID=UPI0036329707
MNIIRYASLKSTTGTTGPTREVAAGPNAQDWDWCISLADATKAGPLPTMAGCERMMAVVDGDLIALTVDGSEQALEKYRPFRFSGDAQSSVDLPTGALKVLHLMTRRGAFKGYAAIIELSKKRPHPVFAEQFAVLLHGSATVSPPAAGGAGGADTAGAAPAEGLGKFDTVVGSEEAPEISGRGFLAVLSIDPA